MKKYKKFFFICAAVFIGLLLSSSILIALKYFSIEPVEKIEKIQFRIANQGEIKLCDPIVLQADINSDWRTVPQKIEMDLPDGLQQISEARFKISKLSWGDWTWSVEIIIQAYKTGDYNEIKGRSAFITKNSKKIEGEIGIEPFSVAALDTKNSQELEIAEKIEKKKQTTRLLIVGLAAGAVAALLIFAILAKRRKRRESQIAVPCWRQALDKLEELRLSQEKRLFPAVVCVGKLCDIIRDYLAERFSIHAPKMTTYEFLESLKMTLSPLSEEHKKFLNEFMESSELIKFANMPANSALLDNAITKAEKLVRESIPNTQGKKDNEI